MLEVVASDDGVVGRAAVSVDPEAEVELALTAPRQVGECTWKVALSPFESEGVIHYGSAEPMNVRTRPHITSMAVWGVPPPVPAGSSLTVKVGLRCSAACRLAGYVLEVRDDSGTTLGKGTLVDEPWTGTDALYWTEIQLAAPPSDGLFTYGCGFSSHRFDLPHDESTATFSFRTTGAAEHQVTIRVWEKSTGTALGDVEVRLGLYRLSTDNEGTARIGVPRGTYEISIRKDGFAAPPMRVDVDADLKLEVEALTAPTMAERAETLTSFEGYPWG